MYACMCVCMYVYIYMRKQECVNKDYAKNTETLKNRNEPYERAYKLQTAQFAQSRCAMRATQGAQCAQPKVRNVMQCAGSRRVMCTTNVLPIAQQDGSG